MCFVDWLSRPDSVCNVCSFCCLQIRARSAQPQQVDREPRGRAAAHHVVREPDGAQGARGQRGRRARRLRARLRAPGAPAAARDRLETRAQSSTHCSDGRRVDARRRRRSASGSAKRRRRRRSGGRSTQGGARQTERAADRGSERQLQLDARRASAARSACGQVASVSDGDAISEPDS